MRKVPFVNGEFYHIYNRGVDKREIFSDRDDLERFFQSMSEFNTVEPIGSIYENSFRKVRKEKMSSLGNPTSKSPKLVNIVCYCLNPNHYHFILEQLTDNGISYFMKRLGGYAKYFNERYKRSGTLFQGRFKAIHVDSNEYLLHLSAYVNLNNHVHQLGRSTSKLVKSSWGEYIGGASDGGSNNANAVTGIENRIQGFCSKDMILGQFKNPLEYKNFAEESLEGIVEKRREYQGLDGLLLE